MCPPQKKAKTQPLFQTAIFSSIFTSNLLSACEKTSLILIISIHLLLSSLEMQRRVMQTYRPSITQVILLFLKRNDSQTFKSSSCKKIFSSLYVIVTICLDKCFLFHVITGRRCFYKDFLVRWGLFNRHVFVLLETCNLKEVRILSPQ